MTDEGDNQDRAAPSFPGAPGEAIVRSSWLGTAVFVVTALVATATEVARPVAAAVAIVLFMVGAVAFLWAYAVAVSRSRNDAIGIGGLYFLVGDTAPSSVRRALLGSLAIQIAVAVGTAAARPYTSLAFGVLVPMFGLGLCGLWGARHGSFRPRARG